jgi:hypothetical protein
MARGRHGSRPQSCRTLGEPSRTFLDLSYIIGKLMPTSGSYREEGRHFTARLLANPTVSSFHPSRGHHSHCTLSQKETHFQPCAHLTCHQTVIPFPGSLSSVYSVAVAVAGGAAQP